MADSTNRFERLVGRGVDGIRRRQEAMGNAFGVNQRPYGTVALNKQQRIEYFAAQPQSRQQELWGRMQPTEQEEIRQGMTGLNK